MKKKFISCLVLLPIVMTAGSVVLSRHFTSDIIDNTKITQKHIRNGTVLVITARDPRIVEKVKKIVTHDINLPYSHITRPNQSLELLRIKQINKSIIYLNNGIKLSLTSEIPEWINWIHQLKMANPEKQKWLSTKNIN